MTLSPCSPKKHSSTIPVFKRFIQRIWRWLFLFLGIALAWNALHDAQWGEIWSLFAGIGSFAILSITFMNLLMLPLMSARWWLLLNTLETPISLLTAALYKNCANAISYFTPGPHFGGEPFSIYLLHHYHEIPVGSAATSVAVDRLLELAASIFVLTLCLLSVQAAKFGPFTSYVGLVIIFPILIGFIAILVALFTGKKPLSRLLESLVGLQSWLFSQDKKARRPFKDIVSQGETLAEELFCEHRRQFIYANLLSFVHWLGIFAELWLMSFFLGFKLSFLQIITITAASRLAFYTPLPAGIGALESALPYVTATLGLGNSFGISLCLIIRFRDIVFGLAGVAQSMKYLTCRKKLSTIKYK